MYQKMMQKTNVPSFFRRMNRSICLRRHFQERLGAMFPLRKHEPRSLNVSLFLDFNASARHLTSTLRTKKEKRSPFSFSSLHEFPHEWWRLLQGGQSLSTSSRQTWDEKELDVGQEGMQKRSSLHAFWQAKSQECQGLRKGLAIVANSLITTTDRVCQLWSMDDLVIGLAVLSHQRSLTRRLKPPEGANLLCDDTAETLVQEFHAFIQYCDAAYLGSVAKFCKAVQLPEESILHFEAGGLFNPMHYLVQNERRRELVLVIRGSAGLEDFATDVCMEKEPFMQGWGHRGMVHSAQTIYESMREKLLDIVTQLPREYTVTLTGHSLGGGTASLLAILLKKDIAHLRCVAFATPACVTLNVGDASRGFISNLVCADDCIPRMNHQNMDRLRREVAEFEWTSTLRSMAASELRQSLLGPLQGIVGNEQMQESLQRMQRTKLKTVDSIQVLQARVTQEMMALHGKIQPHLKASRFVKPKLNVLSKAHSLDDLIQLADDQLDIIESALSSHPQWPPHSFSSTSMDQIRLKLHGEMLNRLKYLLEKLHASKQTTSCKSNEAKNAIVDVHCQIMQRITQMEKSFHAMQQNTQEKLGEKMDIHSGKLDDVLTRASDCFSRLISGISMLCQDMDKAPRLCVSSDSTSRIHAVKEESEDVVENAIMYPPGRLFLIHRSKGTSPNEPEGQRQGDGRRERLIELYEIEAHRHLNEIELSDSMIEDHLCESYKKYLLDWQCPKSRLSTTDERAG